MSPAELANHAVRPDADAVWCEERGRWTQGRNRPVHVRRGGQLVESWDLHPTVGAR